MWPDPALYRKGKIVKLVQKPKKNRLSIGQDQAPVELDVVRVRMISSLRERLSERLWALAIAVVAGTIAGLVVALI